MAALILAGAAAMFGGHAVPTKPRPIVQAGARMRDLILPAEASGPTMTMREFHRGAWDVIEPSTAYVDGYHIGAMCEHVQAVDDGEIKNLLIAVGPRHTKSITCTVCYPAWSWTRHPGKRFLSSSYSSALSTEHAVLSRRIIESTWYQERWGSFVQLTTDQNVKTHYENTARGYRISTSPTGTSIGRGGDVLIGDDLHNLAEIDSDKQREAAVTFYSKTWHGRLNDPKTGCRIYVGHRGHVKDIGAWCIENGYVYLKLPTEYDPKKTVVMTPIGWTDPRTKPGELLCPERFGEAEVAAAKKALGSDDFAAQHNQDPQKAGGKEFKRHWFEIVEAAPANAKRCRGWDAAATEGGGDYTVGTRMSRAADGIFYVEHVVRGQWSDLTVDRMIRQTAKTDGKSVPIREEQEGGSSGKSVIGARKRALAGWDYDGKTSTGEKKVRRKPFKIQCEAGNVKLVEGTWNEPWLDEMCELPGGDHDDQGDSAAIAFEELTSSGGGAAATKVRGA